MKTKKTINKKKEIKTNDRRCTQIQCSFYLRGGCRECDECKADSYIINTDCQKCLSCENIPGNLRWGENQDREENTPLTQSEQDRITAVLKEAAERLEKEDNPEPPKKEQEPMVM